MALRSPARAHCCVDALRSRAARCGATPAGAAPRTRTRLPPRRAAARDAPAESTDPERFVWKGGGDGRGAAWEAAALDGRGGYATDSAGGLQWFFLDAGPLSSSSPPLVLLHGMPAYSYMWRGCVEPLTAGGRRVIALDLPGFGNSAKPAPGDGGFDYSLRAYCASLESVLFGALKLPRGAAGGVDLVGHGVLGGQLAALLASRSPQDVRRLALLNAPLAPAQAAELPQPLRFLTNVFTAPLLAQNPLSLVGNPIQSGGPFVVGPDDTAAYIAPALADSAAGWAAIAVAKALKRDGAAVAAEVLPELERRGEDVLLTWGIEDKWYGAAPPAGLLPRARRKLLEGAGHFAAEDWADKVAQALLTL